MTLLRLAGFSGMWPIRDSRGLPDNAAIEAVNVRSDGGAYLRALSQPVSVKALSGTTKDVFRIPLVGANTLANSFWMEFTDIDTDVQPAPIVNDSHDRFYWASPSTGLRFAPKARILAGQSSFKSGVVAPITAPTVEVVAGTGVIDPETGKHTAPRVTRSYMVSFINVYGEESQPGPIAEEEGHSDQDWLITNIPQPVTAADRPALETIRIYRTVSGSTGLTAFYKVVDLPVGTNNYTDRLPDTTVTGQGAIESVTWAAAPEGLEGLAAMPNGIFVGWKGSTIYFSENYRPHAWPAEYAIDVDFPVVGIGVFQNSAVICTTGNPSIVSGVKANALSLSKIDAPLACLSRGSIVAATEGVYFATDEGLAVVGPGGIGIVTRDLISRDDWRTDYNPATIRATMKGGVYIAMRTGLNDGFAFLPSNPSSMGVIRFEVSQNPINFGSEPWSGKPWFIGADAQLYEWEVPGAPLLSYRWRSKEFKYPYPCNFHVAQLYFDEGPGGVIRLRVWVTLRGNDGSIARLLVYDQDIGKSGSEIKMPSGFRSDIWEFEFEGYAPLQEFLIASTVWELRSG